MKRIAIVNDGVVTNVAAYNDAFVPDNTKTFEHTTAQKGWTVVGGVLTPPSQPAPTKDALALYASGKRRASIAGGSITIPQGQTWIDDATLGALSDAILNIDQSVLPPPLNWKLASGFISASRDDLVAIKSAVAAARQSAFDAESAVQARIASSTITSFAQIDAAAWPSL